MRKLFLCLTLVFFAFSSKAAVLKNAQEIDTPSTGIVFNYEFSINGSNDPLYITESSCYKIKKGEKVKISPNKWDCFENFESSKPDAQAQADKFEANLAKTGHGG